LIASLLVVEINALLSLPLEGIDVLLLVDVILVASSLLLVVALGLIVPGLLIVALLAVPLLLRLSLLGRGAQRLLGRGSGGRSDAHRIGRGALETDTLGRSGNSSVSAALLGWRGGGLALGVLTCLEGGVSSWRDSGGGVDGLLRGKGYSGGWGIGDRRCRWLQLNLGLLALRLLTLGFLALRFLTLRLLSLRLLANGLLFGLYSRLLLSGDLGGVRCVRARGWAKAALLLATHQLLSRLGALGCYRTRLFVLVAATVNVGAGGGAEELRVRRGGWSLLLGAGWKTALRLWGALQNVIRSRAAAHAEQVEGLAVVERGSFAVDVKPIRADLVLLVEHGVVRTQEPEVLHSLLRKKSV